MGDDCVEVARIKQERIEVELPDSPISDELNIYEGRVEQETVHKIINGVMNYLGGIKTKMLVVNGGVDFVCIEEGVEEKMRLNEDGLNEDGLIEDDNNEFPASNDSDMRIPVISDVKSLCPEASRFSFPPGSDLEELPASEPPVKVKLEPPDEVDEISPAIRKVSRSKAKLISKKDEVEEFLTAKRKRRRTSHSQVFVTLVPKDNVEEDSPAKTRISQSTVKVKSEPEDEAEEVSLAKRRRSHSQIFKSLVPNDNVEEDSPAKTRISQSTVKVKSEPEDDIEEDSPAKRRSQSKVKVKSEPEDDIEEDSPARRRSQSKVKVKSEPEDDIEEDSPAKRRSQSMNFDFDQPSTSTAYSTKKIKCEESPNQRTAKDKNPELVVIHDLLTSLQKPVDEDQIYGEHIACELRALRDPLIKRRCKCAITQALLTAMQEDSVKMQQAGK